MIRIELSYDEMILLDGKVGSAAQKIIDFEKRKKNYGFEFDFINEAIAVALENGYIRKSNDTMRHCKYCDKKYDYYEYKSTTKYHRKGEKNHEKPVRYAGIKFVSSNVLFSGTADICMDCAKKYNVVERTYKYIVDKNMPIEIQIFGYTTKYKKDDMQICKNCNKEIYESEMGRSPTIFDGGSYPSTCPYCKSESTFGNHHQYTNKYRMILATGVNNEN